MVLRCMELSDAWQCISIINPSLLPERDNEVKERNEKKVPSSEIVVVSGYKKSSLGSRIRRGLNKQQSRIVSDAL